MHALQRIMNESFQVPFHIPFLIAFPLPVQNISTALLNVPLTVFVTSSVLEESLNQSME
ncbi:MAG: hypothetical protein OJF50_001995 [Nitrospira sp.]|nr:hypothetical protein [Nitrospira sp.]